MSTLVVDLNSRVATSPKYPNMKSPADYFARTNIFKTWYKPTDKHHKSQENAIRQWLSNLNPKQSLELGPGLGRITQLLVDKHPESELKLVEINKEYFKELSTKFPRRTLINADVEKYNFGKNKYDLVVATGLLVHIPNIDKLITKVHSSLTPGGTFITSITPESWYVKNRPGVHNLDRGIDEKEFEEFVSKFFDIEDIHKSKNGQHITYNLKKNQLS